MWTHTATTIGDINIEWTLNKMVLQPTTFCNINCAYCYLPNRSLARRMSPDVTRSIAASLVAFNSPVAVIWHGGEPLAVGREHFEDLIRPLAGPFYKHAIQTNATLITREWCEIFNRYSISVGVSIDGPVALNNKRVDRAGRPTFDSVMEGLGLLREAKIPYGIIAVVSGDALESAREVYEFAQSTGCHSLAINIEETEGIHVSSVRDCSMVNAFWTDLFTAWRRSPTIRVREIQQAMSWLKSQVKRTEKDSATVVRRDIFPTIAWNGDMVCLSPELAGTKSSHYGDFYLGNVVTTPLPRLLGKAVTSEYVKEYLEGLRRCHTACEYYGFCGGGDAGNKYFEHGTFDVARTVSCSNTRIRLMDAIVEAI